MWRHSMSEGCVFCDQSWMRAGEIIIETPTAYSPPPGTRTSGPRPDCRAGTRAVSCIPICTSFHDSTTSRCLTADCARRSTSRKTDGPIHGRPGADGNFGVPSERGARDHSVVRLMLLVPWAAQAVPWHLDQPSG